MNKMQFTPEQHKKFLQQLNDDPIGLRDLSLQFNPEQRAELLAMLNAELERSLIEEAQAEQKLKELTKKYMDAQQ